MKKHEIEDLLTTLAEENAKIEREIWILENKKIHNLRIRTALEYLQTRIDRVDATNQSEPTVKDIVNAGTNEFNPYIVKMDWSKLSISNGA